MFPETLQDIILTMRNEDDEVAEFKVRVVEVTDTEILMTAPIDHNGYAQFIPLGARVNVGYVSNGYVNFETTVSAHVRDRIPLVVIVKPPVAEIRKDQRRQSFRVPVTLRSTVQVDDHEVLMNLLDLSAGGFLATSSDHTVRVDSEVSGNLLLDLERGRQTVTFTGTVTRVSLEPKTNDILYGIEFHDMGVQEDMVMRYCMERQRRYLRTLNDSEESKTI